MIAKGTGLIRIVSLNANGLRSASSKGFIEWLDASDIDIICIQETRIQSHQWLDSHKPALWHTHLFPAVKPGYAGTAIYSRHPFTHVKDGLGFELCDSEGRCTIATFEVNGKTFDVASVYIPSGSSGETAQARKDEFILKMLPIMQQWRADNRSVIVCSDVNITHKDIDLKNWRGNIGNSGCLPHERAWMDEVFATGYIDTFRELNKNAEEYSWWSNRGQAWAKNVGWRIDYQIASNDWLGQIKHVFIYRDTRFSDHSPVVIDYQVGETLG
jgi:exodeoxyribonuclease-3